MVGPSAAHAVQYLERCRRYGICPRFLSRGRTVVGTDLGSGDSLAIQRVINRRRPSAAGFHLGRRKFERGPVYVHQVVVTQTLAENPVVGRRGRYRWGMAKSDEGRSTVEYLIGKGRLELVASGGSAGVAEQILGRVELRIATSRGISHDCRGCCFSAVRGSDRSVYETYL